jgi:chorismate dehydratase
VRVGRIPYVNCYPVYGAVDRRLVPLNADLVSGVPSELNALMAAGHLHVSVVSAVEYARQPERYYLLPNLAISCDGPVRSVLLLSRRPASDLGGVRVIVSRSSMTSVALLELLFRHVWRCAPEFVAGDAELSDLRRGDADAHEARLIIGDAALSIGATLASGGAARPSYPHVYDLGAEWKRWTGQPFVFAVWVAQRAMAVERAMEVHAALTASRDWGLRHLTILADEAARATGVPKPVCLEYLSGLDYDLSYSHLSGLEEFFRRLAASGRTVVAPLAFLPAA